LRMCNQSTLTCNGTGHRDEGLKRTGMAERDLDVLTGEDALADLEADDMALAI
jgi:hypothetical protein